MTRVLLHAARWLAGFTPVVLLIAIWQLAGDPRSAFFPTPSTWFAQLEWPGPAGLGAQIRATVTIFVAGVVAAFVAGFVLGITFGRSRSLDLLTAPTLEFARAIPAPTVVPLFILFAGPDTGTLVLSVLFAAVWPILLNTMESARAIEPVLLDSARTLRLSALDRFGKIIVPATLPGAMVGLRVALPIALVVALLAEMLTGAGGLGGALMQAQRSYATATAFGLLVVAGSIGLLISMVFGLVQRLLLRVLSG